jgi:hypothetical protein
MIGRPLEVDELSLRKWETDPICMRFQCRFPERIKGTVQLCVNGETFTIGVQAELPGRGGGSSGAPKPPPPPHDDSLDDDSEDRSTGDRNWKRRSGKEKEQQGQGQEVNSHVPGGSGNVQKSGPGVANEARAVAGVDSISQGRDPMEGINQYGSNAAASDALLRSLERGKSTEKAPLTQGLSGEGKTLGASFDLAVEEAEGTQVSAETGS